MGKTTEKIQAEAVKSILVFLLWARIRWDKHTSHAQVLPTWGVPLLPIVLATTFIVNGIYPQAYHSWLLFSDSPAPGARCADGNA